MEQLSANVAGKVQRRSLHGREYFVVPMSMIVPGVLNGSRGPLYYPLDEISRNFDAWNNMPIVVNHPMEGDKPVSARSPEVLEQYGIGTVFNTVVNGKLVAEGWLDIERTRTVAPSVYAAISEGRPVELSTGLFTDNEKATDGANFNGTPYSFIARNYRPDHLAVLPNQRGACSLMDGCGVLVNEAMKDTDMDDDEFDEMLDHVEEMMLNADDELLADNAWSKAAIDAAIAARRARAKSSQDRSAQVKERISKIKALREKVSAAKSAQVQKRISEIKAEREKRRAAGKEMMARYKAVGKTTTNAVLQWFKDVLNWNVSVEEQTDDQSGSSDSVTQKETTNMAKLTDVQRKGIVDTLTTNCDCWKGSNADDLKALNGLSDDKLQALLDNHEKTKQTALIANAATKGIADKEGNQYVFNGDAGKWEVKPAATKKEEPTANAGKEVTTLKPTQDNAGERLTAEEREAISFANNARAEQKGYLIGQLVGNSTAKSDAEKKSLAEAYGRMNLSDLETLVKNQIKPQAAAPQTYFGMQGGGSYAPTTNRPELDQDDILPLPTVNWEERYKELNAAGSVN